MSIVALETPVDEIELWELHSELVLVSPEVCRRALELLPERDPDAFLARVPESDSPTPVGVVGRYALWRLAQTARFALAITAGSIGLALLAEAVR